MPHRKTLINEYEEFIKGKNTCYPAPIDERLEHKGKSYWNSEEGTCKSVC